MRVGIMLEADTIMIFEIIWQEIGWKVKNITRMLSPGFDPFVVFSQNFAIDSWNFIIL
jgi:hypothetical protein